MPKSLHFKRNKNIRIATFESRLNFPAQNEHKKYQTDVIEYMMDVNMDKTDLSFKIKLFAFTGLHKH